MFTWMCRCKADRDRGFTLIELVVVLAILGILISLAVPRYLAARKKAYKAEADNILQETKSLEWGYYMQYNLFDNSAAGANLGLVMPTGMHWNAPSINGGASLVTMTMSGKISPLGNADSVWITLSGDGSSSGGATF